MKKCPYCAEEIQDKAIVCRYCGRELQGFADNFDVKHTKVNSTKKRRSVFLPALLFGIGMGILGFVYDIKQPIQFPRFGDSGHFNNAFMMGISNIFIYGGLYSFVVWIKRSFVKKEPDVSVFSSQSGFASLIIFTLGLGFFMLINILPATQESKPVVNNSPKPTATSSIEICLIRATGQTYQIAFSGKGSSSVCERIISNNKDTYSTSNPIGEKIVCSFKKQNITVNIRDVDYENPSRDHLCSLLSQIDNYESISINNVKSLFMASPTENSTGDCTEWSKITVSDVGKTVCVFGDVRNSWYSENQQAHIITFSGDPKDIYFIMYGDWTFTGLDGKCVKVNGKIEKVYETPVIKIPVGNSIYMCE